MNVYAVKRYLCVFAGAAVGALLRWGVGLYIPSTFYAQALLFLVLNLAGSILLALVSLPSLWEQEKAKVEGRAKKADPLWFSALGTGFCGTITTYSSVAVLAAVDSPGMLHSCLYLFGGALLGACGAAIIVWWGLKDRPHSPSVEEVS